MIGIRELLVIGMMVLVLYGRSGVLKGERAQAVLPWLSPVRRTSARRGQEPVSTPRTRKQIALAFLTRGNRLYWFFTILAATAVAAWIVTRTLVASGTGPRLSP
ncbi:hypothetical protein [Aquisphaera insulae]|uniref:hypothetical protein n=1 Tax=Aquisphaera insulae TaxID=2712864 RepID=UPI0013ECFE6F|nr:hypothetical protein [Aquisphaera insulae]